MYENGFGGLQILYISLRGPFQFWDSLLSVLAKGSFIFSLNNESTQKTLKNGLLWT